MQQIINNALKILSQSKTILYLRNTVWDISCYDMDEVVVKKKLKFEKETYAVN